MLPTTALVLIGLSCLAATQADTAVSVPGFGVSEPDEVFTSELSGVGESEVGTANGSELVLKLMDMECLMLRACKTTISR
ncbi:hypothetical protein WJX82_010906 [Trebouxia sp. C0006]